MYEFQQDIDHLILMYLHGEATQGQIHALNDWVSASEKNELIFLSIQNVWQQKPRSGVLKGTLENDRIWK